MSIIDKIVRNEIATPLFGHETMFFKELSISLKTCDKLAEMYREELKVIDAYVLISKELKEDMGEEDMKRKKINAKMQEGFHIYSIIRTMYYSIVKDALFLTPRERDFFTRLVRLCHGKLRRYDNLAIDGSDTSESKSSI